MQNSLGQEIQNYEQFKKWFGNSITIDEHGRPLVFFHGTDKKFSEFKAGYGNGLIFFAYNKAFADDYGKTKSINHGNRGEREVLGCYLKVKKIFVPERDYELLTDTIIEVFKLPANVKDLANKSDLTDKEKKMVEYFDDYMYYAKNGSYIILERNEIVDKIWSLGFDALELSEQQEKATTLAVKAGNNQIKSVDNNGNWSDSENIYEEFNDNFWKWFSDSEAVDENGNPLVVYHGTDKDFTEFNRKFAKNGFFFVTEKRKAEVAGYYAYSNNRKGKIMPCYLSIKNPYICNPSDRDKVDLSEYDGIIVVSNYNHESPFYDYEKQKLNTSKLNKGDIIEIIVFNPNQIKSVDNNGDWSSSDNIYEQLNEEIKKYI